MTEIFIVLLSIQFIIIFFLLLKNKPNKEKFEKERKKFNQELEEKQQKFQKEMHEKAIKKEREISKEWETSMSKLMERIKERENDIEKDLKLKREERILALEEEIKLYKEQAERRKIEIEKDLELDKKEFLEQWESIKKLLEEAQSKQDSIIEANKRSDEIRQKDNFYKISFSSDESEELIELNKAIKKLRNPMPFRKAVYDVYYKPKINELVNRVIGRDKICGIYKITHIESQKIYIGQSVDIGNRWKQHAKRGCGADVLTQNKLYPALIEYGLESFTWEVVEEVEKDKLSDSEKYWQDFYKAKEFGYSIK